MRRFQKNTVAIALCGISLLVIAVSFTASRMLQANATSDELANVRITADGPLTVEAGGSIRLTAEGDYGTATMPVRADWSIGSGVPATVGRCRNAKQCTMTAGEEAGMVEVIADAEGYHSTVFIEVTETLKNPFTDALPDWATPSIIHLYRAGIIKGYDDNRYGPADPVTRGQVITLLYRMLRSADLIGMGKTGCNAYGDVLPGDYMEEAVCAFAAEGWGFDEENYLPNDAASRGIVARLVAIVGQPLFTEADLDVESLADGPQVFDDVPRGNAFFTEVAITNALGVMTGYPTGDFGIQDSINRASMAVILDRLLDQFHHAGMGQSPMHNVAPVQPGVAGSVSSSSEPKTAVFASSGNEAIPCHDSDGGENLFDQGIIYGTFHGQPDRAWEFEDECLSLSTVKEYSCDRGLYIGYSELQCPGASTCRNGGCIRIACEDSDSGQDFAVQGTVSVRNTDTGEVEFSSTDECVDYGRAVHQAEYYCGSDGRILNTGKVCPNGCADGVCLQASSAAAKAVSPSIASSMSSLSRSAAASASSRPASVASQHRQATGIIDLSNFFQGLNRVSKYYDFSMELYRRDQNDKPWDFRFSLQSGAGFGLGTSYLEAASREGSTALFAMPMKRYEELTEDDCKNNPDYASNHEAIIFGYNATVICFKTDDGVVGKMRGGPSDTDRVEFTIWK
ncbi:MAG: S-layer homology domain-containing protein [Candidatus Peregrinibacteria bacterium]|nr:S-layer homology domain-containing protein [Candidatus Peregrinibacteria bacterium]